jgi:DNA-binding response OmpR family regulator
MSTGRIGQKVGRKTVLLVEDDDDERDALAALLEEADYQVLQAPNGAEALRLLESRPDDPCDIILLDLMMPVMNGWDFRRLQKRRAALANIPVVLMSAGAQIAFAVEDLDAAGYVAKPVEIDDLLDKVERHSN